MNGWTLAIELIDRHGAPHALEVATVREGDRDVVWIGRGTNNGIAIREGNVSRRHCCLIVDASGAVVIRDSGSTNGTWVNGARIPQSAPFGLDDRLYLGDHVLHLLAAPRPRPGWRVTLAIGHRRGGDEQVVTAECRCVADDRHELTIGQHADLSLDSRNASRVHCAVIVNDAGAAWVTDRARATARTSTAPGSTPRGSRSGSDCTSATWCCGWWLRRSRRRVSYPSDTPRACPGVPPRRR